MHANLFDKLSEKDEITWTTMISAYVESAVSSESLSLFPAMRVDPVYRMDPFSLSLVLKACGMSFGVK
jgi:hypothetical protein